MAYIDPMNKTAQHHDYQRIEQALVYLEAHRSSRPTLEDVAGHVGLSPFHFQRLFSRWVGISPKRFLRSSLSSMRGSVLLKLGRSLMRPWIRGSRHPVDCTISWLRLMP